MPPNGGPSNRLRRSKNVGCVLLAVYAMFLGILSAKPLAAGWCDVVDRLYSIEITKVFIGMSAQNSTPPTPWVALFDLDGTLTWRDTLLPYLWGYLLNHPLRAFRLWRAPIALYRYRSDRDRGTLKSSVIRMIMGGEPRARIESWTARFVAALKPQRRFRPLALAVLEAHRAAGDRLVLLSASPDLYVPQIGALLGFEHILCTELLWQGERLDGRLLSQNRRGEEKLRCLESLRRKYPGAPIIAYGNSSSDLDHMRHADRALLVNGNMEARRLAKQSDIEVSSWT
jgi:phosphatidylglycerophosphatase C